MGSNNGRWQAPSKNPRWMAGWQAIVTDKKAMYATCVEAARELGFTDDRAIQAAAATLYIAAVKELQVLNPADLWQPSKNPTENLKNLVAYSKYTGQSYTDAFVELVKEMEPDISDNAIYDALKQLGVTPARAKNVKDFADLGKAIIILCTTDPDPADRLRMAESIFA